MKEVSKNGSLDGIQVFGVGYSLGGLILCAAQQQSNTGSNKLFEAMALSSPLFSFSCRGPMRWVGLISSIQCFFGRSQISPIGDRWMSGSKDARLNLKLSHSRDRIKVWELMRETLPQYLISRSPTFAWLRNTGRAARSFRKNWFSLNTPSLLLIAGDDDWVDMDSEELYGKEVKNTTVRKYPTAYHDLLVEDCAIRGAGVKEILMFFSTLSGLCKLWK